MDQSSHGLDESGPDFDTLRRIGHELEGTREQAEALAGDLTDRQLWWRPEGDRWSVGECLDHLVRAGEIYLETLDEVIEEAWDEGRTASGGYRPGPVGRWVVRLLEPPPGLRVPAPGVIRPRRPEGGVSNATRPGAAPGGGGAAGRGGATGRGGEAGGGAGARSEAGLEPLPRFLALEGRLVRRLAQAQGLDLRRVKLTSPFVPLLRVDLGSAFRVVAVHERRHLWQARQVTGAPGFPEG